MKYLLTFALIFFSFVLFAQDNRETVLNFSQISGTGFVLTDNTLNFQFGEGEIKGEINLIPDRIYKILITNTGDNITTNTNIKFSYKYAYVGEYSYTSVFNSGTNDISGKDFVIPQRFDKITYSIKFKGANPFTVSSVSFVPYPEPPFYGYFITPFWKNTLSDENNDITFRFFCDIPILQKENQTTKIKPSLIDSSGNPQNLPEKDANSRGYIIFKKPENAQGNYTFKVDIQSGEEIVYTYQTPITFSNTTDEFFCDLNGRINYQNQLIIPLGLMGATNDIKEEAKLLGINFFIDNNEITGFNLKYSAPEDFWNFEALNNIKVSNPNTPIITYVPNLPFGPLVACYSDLLAFEINEKPKEKIKAFFDDYGFYYPLINIIDISNENYLSVLNDTLSQTQTGFIFKIKSKEDFEKLKPILQFFRENKDIILSNEEPKSLVFGNCSFFNRKLNDTEYVYLFETKGKNVDIDVFAPGKKDIVSAQGKQLVCDKKDKTKYSMTLTPFEYKIITIKTKGKKK